MAGTKSQAAPIITLSSGLSRGSNLLAIHSYFLEHNLPIYIDRAVFTNKASEAIRRAEEKGIPTIVYPAKDITLFEEKVMDLVKERGIKLIALCGFMKLISKEFIENVDIPILNIHPALLPKYGGKGMYGGKVHQAVFEAKESISGATVHLVNSRYDEGEIVVQKSVDISDCFGAEEIAVKVLRVEHQIYGEAIKKTFRL